MSSPIAKKQKSAVDRALIATHQKMSHSRRIAVLARELARRIPSASSIDSCGLVRVLDVGCGDMTLADAIEANRDAVDIRCVDIHECPPALLEADPRWGRYTSFDGVHLPFDAASFDVVLFSDVLHHVPETSRPALLREAARVGRAVVVKDHFEYGWWSRQSLRAMDWVGNFGYGVLVPERYFDAEGFELLCDSAGLAVGEVNVGIQLYDHLPLVRSVLKPSWQFIATCHPKVG